MEKNNKIENEKRVKCPFCAELILPEARICRFCHSNLEDKKTTNPEKPGIITSIISNIICPGLAAWRLGHKKRGAIIFVLIMGCLVIYAQQITPIIDKAVQTAVRTGNTTKLNKLTAKLENNPWGEGAFYIYIYSFIDIYFLINKSEKQTNDKTKEN
ncbi:MAG: hypothetical protein ACQETH_16100 [Candidatus Rifleibacteriota bacterium]